MEPVDSKATFMPVQVSNAELKYSQEMASQHCLLVESEEDFDPAELQQLLPVLASERTKHQLIRENRKL